MNQKIINAVKINRYYKTKNIQVDLYKNLSFSFDFNQTVSIMGKSGSGKSSLLNILGGLDKPDSGEVFFNGKSIYGSGHKSLCLYRQREVGFIFQSYHLLSELTVLENTLLPTYSSYETKESIEKAKRLLDDVGLSERMHHYPKELSGGEQQRVAVARSLINSPKLILADEPTGNLDQKTSEKVLNYLFKLIETRRITLLIVSHDKYIENLCKKNYVLEQGHLKEVNS